MMCVSYVKEQFIFECTDCDACLPCKHEVTAQTLLVTHPDTPHHKLMALLSEVKLDVVAPETA